MDIVITVLLVILTLYCVVMYVIGIVMFRGIVKSNGGIEKDDLKTLDFWMFVGMLIISPISIPFYALRGD